MASTTSKTNRISAFAENVANLIVNTLEQGTEAWEKKWSTVGGQFMANAKTNTVYGGVNQISLLFEAMDRGYTDHRWITFKQAKEMGGSIKKGEHGTQIVFYPEAYRNIKDINDKKIYYGYQLTPKEKHSGNYERAFIPCINTVFNVQQTEGLNLPPLEAPKTYTHEEISERAEKLIQLTGANIEHNDGDRAFYFPAHDKITLPKKERFETAFDYYDTCLHEIGHWTGHPSRLNRDLTGGFGSEKYAKEELRAEISSLMVAMAINLPHHLREHSAYVGSWIKALRDDPTEILRACRDAEKIQKYVLAFEKNKEVTQEKEPVEKKTVCLNDYVKTIPFSDSVDSEEKMDFFNEYEKVTSYGSNSFCTEGRKVLDFSKPHLFHQYTYRASVSSLQDKNKYLSLDLFSLTNTGEKIQSPTLITPVYGTAQLNLGLCIKFDENRHTFRLDRLNFHNLPNQNDLAITQDVENIHLVKEDGQDPYLRFEGKSTDYILSIPEPLLKDDTFNIIEQWFQNPTKEIHSKPNFFYHQALLQDDGLGSITKSNERTIQCNETILEYKTDKEALALNPFGMVYAHQDHGVTFEKFKRAQTLRFEQGGIFSSNAYNDLHFKDMRNLNPYALTDRKKPFLVTIDGQSLIPFSEKPYPTQEKETKAFENAILYLKDTPTINLMRCNIRVYQDERKNGTINKEIVKHGLNELKPYVEKFQQEYSITPKAIEEKGKTTDSKDCPTINQNPQQENIDFSKGSYFFTDEITHQPFAIHLNKNKRNNDLLVLETKKNVQTVTIVHDENHRLYGVLHESRDNKGFLNKTTYYPEILQSCRLLKTVNDKICLEFNTSPEANKQGILTSFEFTMPYSDKLWNVLQEKLPKDTFMVLDLKKNQDSIKTLNRRMEQLDFESMFANAPVEQQEEIKTQVKMNLKEILSEGRKKSPEPSVTKTVDMER